MVIEISRKKFLICYASEKGTAQSIAEDLNEQCASKQLKFPCSIACISEISNVNKFNDFCCVIFIGSTTGDGDPPETARKFMRDLKDVVSNSSLSWLHYTILGLGDTNYTNFCNFGKRLDQHLQKGKAVRFYNCGWADDGTGLEIVVEPWIEGLFPALEKFLDSPPPKRSDLITAEPSVAENTTESDKSIVIMDNEEVSNQGIQEYPGVAEFNKLIPTLNLPEEEEISHHSVKQLKFPLGDKLTLPNISASYLITEFSDEKLIVNHKDVITKDEVIKYPSTSSAIFTCCISSARRLTTDDAVKTTLEISLKSTTGDHFNYEPGDSFAIIVSNKEEEVDLILHLLQVYSKADIRIKLKVDPSSTKKSASVPKYIPKDCTLRYMFTHCLDIRTIPKKLFLRALVEYTSDFMEKRRLMEFVSREGSEEYNNFIRAGLTLLDLLILFRSCRPPVSLIIEHLPRLLPRPYSITSSPLLLPDEISFAFNVIEIPKGGSVSFSRQGLCTGWLNSLIKDVQKEDNVEKALENLSLRDDNILIYFRCHQNFRLPTELTLPLIMIGPGTGVAPFIGFLKHRNAQIQALEDNLMPTQELYLFFGCRHRERDFLFKHELNSFTGSGVLKELIVSFSRDAKQGGEPTYVQDNLIFHGEKIVDLINNKNAIIYVCGDAKNMSRNVFDTFISLLQKHLLFSELDARKFIAQMQVSNRYMQDVWA